MADVVVFGALASAEMAAVYLEAHTHHRVVAFTADAAYCDRPQVQARPLVPWEELERHFAPERVELLGPVSFRRLNRLRRDRYLEGKRRGYRFVSYVHPSVECLEVSVGENCFICGGVLIEPFARIGDNVMVWSNAHIGHHATVEDHCFIGPGAGVGGFGVVGEMSFLGPKADTMPGVKLGRACFVGARALVTQDVADGSVFPPQPTTKRASYHSSRLVRHV